MRNTVAAQRDYTILTVRDARRIAATWLENMELAGAVAFGLPEIDDRYHVWRVPLVDKGRRERMGEVVIDARTSLICADQTTSKEVLERRLLKKRMGKRKAGTGTNDTNSRPYETQSPVETPRKFYRNSRRNQ